MSYLKNKAVGDVLVVYPKGELTGGDETNELMFVLEEAYEKGTRKVVVNLHDVTYLNSTALGVLIAARQGLQKHNGRITLSNVHDRIHTIFLETKLTLVFDTYDTEQEAIESFKTGVRA